MEYPLRNGEDHGQQRPVLWPLLWSVKRKRELTLVLLVMGFAQCWTEGFLVPYTTRDDVSGIMTSHGPSHLCSQFYIGPQLLQLPLTLQAAPPSTYTQTLLPFRSVCVALCFLKTGATPGSVMFLSLSPAFSRHQYCQPFSVSDLSLSSPSSLWQNTKCFPTANCYQPHPGVFSLGS